MAIPRTWFPLASILALLLLGLPLGAIEAPAAPSGSANQAAGPIGLASGWDSPAAPGTGASRKAPECFAVVASGAATVVAGLESERWAAREVAALWARTPLYLSHCAFLC